MYNLSITLGDEVLEGKGKTVLEALRSIEPPLKIFTKGYIQLECDGKEMHQTWTPAKVRNLFRKLSQSILAKQFEYLLR